MNFQKYQLDAYTAIQEHPNKKDETLNWAIGLGEECGEVFNILKHFYWGGEELKIESLKKELGDVLWYLNALCSVFGLRLEEVASSNLEKLSKRYNEGVFDIEKSKKRHEIEGE